MMTRLFSHARRFTRVAPYQDKRGMRERMYTQRPGNHDFSFTGEFPEEQDDKPVQVAGGLRAYAGTGMGRNTQPMGRMDTAHRHGIELGSVHRSVVIAAALAVLLSMGGLQLRYQSEISQQAKSYSSAFARMEELEERSAELEKQIAQRTNDVNIRQEAVRLGLISPQGISATPLHVPDEELITPAADAAANAESLAIIFGR